MKLINKVFSFVRKQYIELFKIKEVTCTRMGVKIQLDLTKNVDYLFYFDGFENETLNLYLSKIKDGSVIIDVGANIGIYSLLASKKAGTTGMVYAFEPSNWAYSRLTNNINLNGFSNITAVKKGISDATKEMTFNICDDDAYNSLGNSPMMNARETVVIQTISLDEFVKEQSISKIDIIKVDTEGAEYLVFKGAEQTLKTFKPILFFEFNPYTAPGFSFDKLDAVKFLRGLGYTLYENVGNKLVKIEQDHIQTFDIIGFPG